DARPGAAGRRAGGERTECPAPPASRRQRPEPAPQRGPACGSAVGDDDLVAAPGGKTRADGARAAARADQHGTCARESHVTAERAGEAARVGVVAVQAASA